MGTEPNDMNDAFVDELLSAVVGLQRAGMTNTQILADLAGAPVRMAEHKPLTLEALLQLLVDYHDNNESMADACDMPESAAWHRRQREFVQRALDGAGAFPI